MEKKRHHNAELGRLVQDAKQSIQRPERAAGIRVKENSEKLGPSRALLSAVNRIVLNLIFRYRSGTCACSDLVPEENPERWFGTSTKQAVGQRIGWKSRVDSAT